MRFVGIDIAAASPASPGRSVLRRPGLAKPPPKSSRSWSATAIGATRTAKTGAASCTGVLAMPPLDEKLIAARKQVHSRVAVVCDRLDRNRGV